MIKEWLKDNLYFLLRNSWALMYHNIDAHETDPWDLAVHPGKFEEQLRWLKENCNVITVQQMISDWKNGSLKKHSVVLTFDDGYLDNFIHAKPLLEKYNLPATFFIATHNLLTQTPYWWDQLQYIILESAVLPAILNIRVGGKQINFDLEEEKELTPSVQKEIQQWHYPLAPDTKRAQLYSMLSQEITAITFDEQQDVLEQLKIWSNVRELKCPEIMNREQLIELSKGELFTIGAHTVTHAALGKISEDQQRKEMVENKEMLENILNREVKFLAYPYGSYNGTTLYLTKELGFEAAFTTQTIPLQKVTDPAFLGRMPVANTLDYRKKVR
jgi:peptidoglycan/xylan/chitin deacetylase (PgdA/CDA1 family)